VIAALVPAKALVEAKGRLSGALSEPERRELALAMLTDVLAALKPVPEIDTISVVSPDDDVLTLAASLGANTVAEPVEVRGINQALNAALDVMSPAPGALVVVLADVPEITPADVQQAVSALPERGVVICPSYDRGTSLLAMRPPGVIPFRFGPQSFALHRREAAARGIPAEVLRIERLSRDIDTPDDLHNLASRPAETATHRLLARLDVAARGRP
jgi:2-phospho-L-lactate guanylyltransferase